MFPPCRDRLQKDLQWLEKMKQELNGGKDPFQEVRSMFAKCDPISLNEYEEMLKTLEKESPASSPTPDAILQCLMKRAPLFAKAWELANLSEKIKIFECDRQSNDLPAFYSASRHEIKITNALPVFWRIYGLIFETFNALQRESFQKIESLAAAGTLNREEYTLLKEYLEYETAVWTNKILKFKDSITFIDIWKIKNTNYAKNLDLGSYIHADFYRKAWDMAYGFSYLKKHPEHLKK